MAKPIPFPIDPPPGLVRTESPLAIEGRYIDGQWVRFNEGKPEKIGGWEKYSTAPFTGICRALLAWDDLTARTIVAAATTKKLYYLDPQKAPADITPELSRVTVANPFAITTGSRTVSVTHNSHGKVRGQWVEIQGSTAASVPNGRYEITSIVGLNLYQIEVAAQAVATSSATGGGAVTLIYDIDPQIADPSKGFGYGVGGYGLGTYGTPRESTPVIFEPSYWTLANFGQRLLSNPFSGKLYEWDPTERPVPRATPVAPLEAPGAMRGFFVDDQRFVIALGSSPDTTDNIDPMLLRWCAQANYNLWTPGVTNNANRRRLQRGKRIIAGAPFTSGLNLIWTDTCLYLMQFTGGTFVYDTRPAGDNCGISGPHAYVTADNKAFWFGPAGMFMYAGGVQPIPKSGDISNWVADNLRPYYENKTFAFFVPKFREVWFLFVGPDAEEPNLYAVVNIDDYSWTTGTLERTAATRLETFDTRPLMASLDGYVYQHETGLDADGVPIESWITSSLFEPEEGLDWLDVQGFFPSFARQSGPLEIAIEAWDREMDPALIDVISQTFQPRTGSVDMRTSGRALSYTLRSYALGGDYRVGKFKVEVNTGGSRR